ncbi:hypothetical protein ABL78_6472 [Leptomonas seymouri]|uniref:Uncharacterized protein n=1 Tax=Leptomonas seymouri TaxID=5684 RepID=A0A0N0P3S3_LEPSE|nr:hypothetical protein ABL78_6472 [Leptomonas seymouri]|eukprot:KPI84466.1 hypothetical protein ABL78_6472 [Leptomonas seymouri]
MPTKAAPARRTRREPTYFYKSASASVEGKVRFSEGCVVLPHARICVPPNFVLEVGPFTLFSDFSELHITASPSSASGATDAAAPAPHAAVTTVRIRSHNHFQSYASLRFDLHAAVSALPQGQPPAALNSKVNEPALALPSEIELLGMGNVFHPFASVHVRMIACAPCALRRIREGGDAQSSEASRQPWQLGDWNVFSAHTRVLLPPRAFDAAPAGRAPSGLQAESSRGPLLSPDPITAPWEVATVQHIHNDDRSISRGDGEHEEGTAEAYRRATTPTMPGRVSVEERLFDHHSSDEDRAAIDTEAANLSPSPAPSSSVARAAAAAAAAASAPTAAPSRATTTSRVVDEGSASRSPPDGARSHALRPTPTRTDNMIYMLHDAAEALSAEMSAAADSSNVVALPRYGVRSVSELPTIVKRIVEEEMQRKEHTEHQQLPSTSPATPEPSPATATAATLANLKSYVSSVHPELRAYTEEHARTQVEQLCRCFIGQYMEEAELQPVDAQCDEASRAR